MPTVNPRVNVTLSPSLDALVGQLATMQRISKSTVLRELLETAEPALRHAVALMVAAQEAGTKARKNLAQDLDRSIRAAEGAAELVLRDLAHTTRDLVHEAETIRGRRTRRGSAAPLRVSEPVRRPAGPPSSNRGVKNGKTVGKGGQP